MTVNELIRKHEELNPRSHFFDKDTLKFFGETISGMYLYKKTTKVKDYSGELHECYVISCIQKNSPLKNKRYYHYFDTTTFDAISAW